MPGRKRRVSSTVVEADYQVDTNGGAQFDQEELAKIKLDRLFDELTGGEHRMLTTDELGTWWRNRAASITDDERELIPRHLIPVSTDSMARCAVFTDREGGLPVVLRTPDWTFPKDCRYRQYEWLDIREVWIGQFVGRESCGGTEYRFTFRQDSNWEYGWEVSVRIIADGQ